ncbi:unnamed protein product [Moneuplotes crassus]|uniref:B box-type domain-containing protein n=1 Tax=Euplotes crassus TaxID=5936 RepID=A0AAD1X5A1_EUPCR|nr:unnamed protein product [Moneuplotes crassus]
MLLCQQKDCTNDKVGFYCNDHERIICQTCKEESHFDCETERDFRGEIERVLTFLKQFMQCFGTYVVDCEALEECIGLKEEIQTLNEKIEGYQQTFEEQLITADTKISNSLLLQLQKFQSNLCLNSFFSKITYLKTLALLRSHKELKTPLNDPKMPLTPIILKNTEFYRSEITKLTMNYKQKLSSIVDEEFEKLKSSKEAIQISNLEHKISDLQLLLEQKQVEISQESKAREILQNLLKTIEDKIDALQQENQQLGYQNRKLLKEIEAIRDLIPSNQLEMDTFEASQKKHLDSDTISPNRESAERFYFKIFEEKATFDSNFKLELALNSLEGRKMVDVCALSKLRLPKIRRICLDSLSDEDERLNMFLKYCIPDGFPFLCLIFGSYFGDTPPIKAKYYLDGLKSALSRAQKEIYLRFLEIGMETLQEIIKSSWNCKKVMIHYCRVSIEAPMNLEIQSQKGEPLEYQTEYLSFYFCGYDNKAQEDFTEEERRKNTEWFDNLFCSISSCSLKHSLKYLNLGYCSVPDSLDSLLSKHDLSNIAIVDESLVPSS